MRIYGLSDLHLSFGIPEKSMEIFGEPWIGYHDKIRLAWNKMITPQDIVLLPGDISWAMTLEEVKQDFKFLSSLPGNKYMIRGNHDYWSSASAKKLSQYLPPQLHYLSQGFAVLSPQCAVVGVRLWDSPTIQIDQRIFAIDENATKAGKKEYTEQDQKIFLRELNRLQRALEALPKETENVIVMTHYPPISYDGTPSMVSDLLESDGRVTHCLFGHLHKVRTPLEGFGKIRGITYTLLSADYVNFVPQVIV